MGKHSKKDDKNSQPWDPTLTPAEKAKEFDEQWAQNSGKPKPFIERRKGRHGK